MAPPSSDASMKKRKCSEKVEVVRKGTKREQEDLHLQRKRMRSTSKATPNPSVYLIEEQYSHILPDSKDDDMQERFNTFLMPLKTNRRQKLFTEPSASTSHAFEEGTVKNKEIKLSEKCNLQELSLNSSGCKLLSSKKNSQQKSSKEVFASNSNVKKGTSGERKEGVRKDRKRVQEESHLQGKRSLSSTKSTENLSVHQTEEQHSHIFSDPKDNDLQERLNTFVTPLNTNRRQKFFTEPSASTGHVFEEGAVKNKENKLSKTSNLQELHSNSSDHKLLSSKKNSQQKSPKEAFAGNFNVKKGKSVEKNETVRKGRKRVQEESHLHGERVNSRTKSTENLCVQTEEQRFHIFLDSMDENLLQEKLNELKTSRRQKLFTEPSISTSPAFEEGSVKNKKSKLSEKGNLQELSLKSSGCKLLSLKNKLQLKSPEEASTSNSNVKEGKSGERKEAVRKGRKFVKEQSDLQGRRLRSTTKSTENLCVHQSEEQHSHTFFDPMDNDLQEELNELNTSRQQKLFTEPSASTSLVFGERAVQNKENKLSEKSNSQEFSLNSSGHKLLSPKKNSQQKSPDETFVSNSKVKKGRSGEKKEAVRKGRKRVKEQSHLRGKIANSTTKSTKKLGVHQTEEQHSRIFPDPMDNDLQERLDTFVMPLNTNRQQKLCMKSSASTSRVFEEGAVKNKENNLSKKNKSRELLSKSSSHKLLLPKNNSLQESLEEAFASNSSEKKAKSSERKPVGRRGKKQLLEVADNTSSMMRESNGTNAMSNCGECLLHCKIYIIY